MLAFVLILLGMGGCGYTTGSILPGNYKTLYVEPFKNSVNYLTEGSRTSYIPLMESKVRSAIIDRFMFDGHLRIAKSDVADLVLKGELISFEREELRMTDNQDVQEYRIRVTISLTIIDTVTGDEFVKEPSFAGEASYFTSGPQAKSESAAIEEALTDLSRRVVERTIENW